MEQVGRSIRESLKGKMGAFIMIMMPSLSCMYFLKLKIEANNKAIQLTLIKKNSF